MPPDRWGVRGSQYRIVQRRIAQPRRDVARIRPSAGQQSQGCRGRTQPITSSFYLLKSDNFSAVLYRAWLFASAGRWGRIRMKFVVKMRASCL
jgi:hypothetical protein